MNRPIEVLVVDDSAFMRRAITAILEREPDIRVVATARNGEEGVEKFAQCKPDVVTMDVEMPGMGGLQAVRSIVSERRGVPIVMVSSLTRDGAETTFRALEFGAVDFVAKPDAAYANIEDVARDLVAKVRSFAGRGARPLAARDALEHQPLRDAASAKARPAPRSFGCVAIGSSTGGPVALAQIVPRLPAAFPPTLIVQHMPVGFTRPLAERLDAQSTVQVAEASDGTLLETGTVLVIPSGHQIRLTRAGADVVLHLVPGDGTSLHVPSVDAMALEVAQRYGPASLGVILTGMGQDGVKGLEAVKARGGYVVGQDEPSCVVYGMPRAAANAGLVDRVVPLGAIARVLAELTGTPNLSNS